MVEGKIRIVVYAPAVAKCILEVDPEHLTDGCGFDPATMTSHELGEWWFENDHHAKGNSGIVSMKVHHLLSISQTNVPAPTGHLEDDETTEPETVVVFRKWRDTGEVIALFPQIDGGRGLCSSFEHVGQHGGADYDGVISRTDPATEDEYADLKKELESEPYNYKLIVRKRRPGRM